MLPLLLHRGPCLSRIMACWSGSKADKGGKGKKKHMHTPQIFKFMYTLNIFDIKHIPGQPTPLWPALKSRLTAGCGAFSSFLRPQLYGSVTPEWGFWQRRCKSERGMSLPVAFRIQWSHRKAFGLHVFAAAHAPLKAEQTSHLKIKICRHQSVWR